MQSNLPAVIENSAKQQGLALTNVNLIMPTESFGSVLGAFDKVTIETVSINTDDNQEVYEPNGKGKGFALGKVPLQKIAAALSIEWHPQYTGIVESTSTRSRAKAVGIMKKPNGEVIVQTEEKTIDLDVERENERAKAEKNAEGGKVVRWEDRRPIKEPWKNDAEKERWIELEIENSIKQKRRFKDELALTGAKHRVIRAFLALKPTFTKEELSKPLAFPRVMLDTDKLLANPMTREVARQQITGAVQSIFGAADVPSGSPAVAQLEAPPAEAENFTVVPDDDEPFTLESESADSEKTEEQKHREDVVAKLEEWAMSYDNHGQPRAAQSLRAIAADDSVDLATIESYLNSAADRAQRAGW